MSGVAVPVHVLLVIAVALWPRLLQAQEPVDDLRRELAALQAEVRQLRAEIGSPGRIPLKMMWACRLA